MRHMNKPLDDHVRVDVVLLETMRYDFDTKCFLRCVGGRDSCLARAYNVT